MVGLASHGFVPVPVSVNIDELETWCRHKKLKNIKSSRPEFASEEGMAALRESARRWEKEEHNLN